MVKVLKVLFLLEDLCFGGTQKQNLALASGLDRTRFSTRILTLTGPTDLDGEVPPHISLNHMSSSRKPDPFFFYKLGAEIKRNEPDILVPCTALPNIWGRIWGKLLDVPVLVGTCRGGGAPTRQHERFLWRLATHIVCNSSPLLSAMREKGVPASHLTCIPNGVDTHHFAPARKKESDNGPLIVCVARLARDKDHPTLLEAFEILARANRKVRLRLVGEGPEEKKLRSIIVAMPSDIARRIELAGACADPAPHYAEADLFALSSIREGQPNVLLEAMSSGLPICATAVGGIPDLIDSGMGGLLSPSENPAQLAKNMSSLLENSEARAKFGQHNRAKVENSFSFEKMISTHEALFDRLWEERAPR